MSLSVVIASYNRPHSLSRCIESALAQSSVEEIIVVDDASPAAPSLVGLDADRIRLVRHEENRGVCAARNTGLSLVDTDYVAFLDDDDRLLAEAFEPLLDALEGNDLAVAVGTVIVERNGKVQRVHRPPSSEPGQIWGMDEYLLFDGERSFACKQSAVYPAQLLRDLEGFNENLRSRSQSELFFRICAQYPVIGVDHPVYSLSRENSERLTGDSELREASHQYLQTVYSDLLLDPERFNYFQRVHRINLRRNSPWYRLGVHVAKQLGLH